MRRSTPSPRTKAGKGKVTPVQIAFLVDRYLSDNNFTAALSAFRSDASDLFSKTKGKGVPKGLLSLGDILDDYITLKEQKLAVDEEKKKVESLIRGIQDAVRAYQSNAGTASPPLPQPPPTHLVTAANQPPPATAPLGSFRPPMLPANPKNVTPPDNTIQCIPVRKTRISILPNTASEVTNNSATTHAQSRSKRKTSNSEDVEIQTSKKSRAESSDVREIGGVKLPSQVNAVNSMGAVLEEKSSGQCKMKPLVHGSAVRKNLFRQTPESNKLSSPKTPPQSSSSSQSDNSSSPADPPHQSQHNTGTTQEMTPSKHSVISSKKIIVISPLKQAGYYSVERSHHVSTSPLKSSPGKLGKRDHVKGRLDFDNSEASPDNGKAVISYADNVEKTDDIFDMDLLDLGGDCFSQLLLDFDLDGVDFPFQPSSNSPAKFSHRYSQENDASFVETGQDHSNQPRLTGVLSTEETKTDGTDSMESVQTVTKCISIVSPVKKSSSLDQAGLKQC